MRRFIRHPSSMPIDFQVVGGDEGLERLRNISAGGLCFASQQAMEPGELVHVSIQLGEERFEADGRVAWCHGVNGHHEIGLSFRDAATVFAVRMVEQLCYIEQYRQHVRHTEGRELNSEEAADEWIARYAAEFPSFDS
jgi:hypothetical protein